MASILAQRNQAYQDHSEKFRCDHEKKELRKRTIKGGATQYVEQCLRCGKAMSQPYAKEKALQLNRGKEPGPFDDELLEEWETSYSEGFKVIEKEYGTKAKHESAEFKKWYEEYLLTDIWKQKSKKVMERAGGICEGCLEKPATEVHHLTYRDVGEEYLFQLVAICRECHGRYHNKHPSVFEE